ncbi:protein TolQ [Glaciimonas sp. PCH181]|uniref:protein TolQ n=1 Tax=Glaciimonas sp. PCH181 TaxID=2133943 RepID=UPI000D3AE18B|nr:protein TolQ [Glaciimonas sp. PCH181]PUA19648.1 protein TolQ [Glaciimonas sp. PCH181]
MNPTQIAAHLSPWELFLQADVIVKSILIVLALASVASWGVIIEKLVRFRRLRNSAGGWLKAVAGERSLTRLGAELKQQPQDPFARIYHAIAGEWHQTHKQDLQNSASGRDSLKERINRVGQIASGVEIEKLQKGLSVLATVGSVAPFVGLFGTVWGIMNAFQGIAASNNTSLAVVAPGIAEALFATALGLVAAIPAVVAYNRASGDLNNYANRLATLIGLVEVQLSRQLESGEALIDSDAISDKDKLGKTIPLDRHAHKAPHLAAQGA